MGKRSLTVYLKHNKEQERVTLQPTKTGKNMHALYY